MIIMTNDIKIDSSSFVDHVMVKMGGKIKVGKDCVINGELVALGGKITIGNNVVINKDTKIFCHKSVTIEDHVMISWGCNIVDSNMHSLHSEERKKDTLTAAEAVRNHTVGQNVDLTHVAMKPIVIKEGAWIGFNVTILKGVTIGKGAIVGAGSFVVKDVPDYAVIGGNPPAIIEYTD
jgi:galactoside O-acetyltransferase